MLQKILPTYIFDAILKKININNVYEIRLRTNKPIVINYNGQNYYLTQNGLSMNVQKALVCDFGIINDIIFKACEYSLYAVTNQINNGFLTIIGGIRIGICGEVVYSENSIKTIKNYNSINIRIPHEIKGCSKDVIIAIKKDGIHNTLIISPPGGGKTTLLRDIARELACDSNLYNILLIDERYELAAVHNGCQQLDVGNNVDIVSNAKKEYAFEQAIRCMHPDVIITDELGDERDIDSIKKAISCGVKIIASIHGNNHEDLFIKDCFSNILKNKMFDLYIDLKKPKCIPEIFNSEFQQL